MIKQKEFIKPTEKQPQDDTKQLLADIISWELDLSAYPSLETILRERYSITLKKGVKPFSKKKVHELIEYKKYRNENPGCPFDENLNSE